MRVAYQGEVGAFSEEAALAQFPEADPRAFPTFEAVFDAVASGSVERAIIPIENSLFGSVHLNYDLLREHELHIVGEQLLRIRHHLMARPGTALEDVRRVLSHPQALGQCRRFLRTALSRAEEVPVYDTAGAAKMVAASDAPDEAAIASEKAAAEYGLDILVPSIESDVTNYTRFLVLAREPASPPSPSADRPVKTSIVYSMQENVPGALFKSLAVFALRDLDLFKIESRPLIGAPGSYLFYLDVQGHVRDEPLHNALNHLREIASYVRVLGSYLAAPPANRT